MQKSRRRKVDGILLLDKPLGLSSNTALQIVRRLYNADKAGHTGNLDPLATGLLPVVEGKVGTDGQDASTAGLVKALVG